MTNVYSLLSVIRLFCSRDCDDDDDDDDMKCDLLNKHVRCNFFSILCLCKSTTQCCRLVWEDHCQVAVP